MTGWSAFELISGVALQLVAQASSGAARSAGRASVVRAAAGGRQRGGRAACGAGGKRARAGAREAGIVADATIAQSEEQAGRLWALRENISEAQRREGPNIKHDISLPVSAIPAFLDDARRGARRGAFPARGSSSSAIWATATCTTTSRRRRARRARRSSTTRRPRNRIVHDPSSRRGGSISAEHGIGQLKRDELAHYKAPSRSS